MEHKPLYDVFCPLCNHSVGVRGERTAEIYHQYVAWCKYCKTEFVISYFKAVEYDSVKKRSATSLYPVQRKGRQIW